MDGECWLSRGSRESRIGSYQTDTERIQRQNPSNSFIAKSLNCSFLKVSSATPLIEQRQVNLARTYHSRVLQTVAHVPFDMGTNGAAPSLLLVPICQDYARVAQFDWNTIENFIRWPNPYSLFI